MLTFKIPGLISKPRPPQPVRSAATRPNTSAQEQIGFDCMLVPDQASMTTVFHSGCSSIADFKGTVMAGAPVGVALPHCSQSVISMIPEAARQVPVFIDSGAFSEIRSNKMPDFTKIIDTYHRLAKDTRDPSALYCVAPDCVGDQIESIRRLRKWRSEVAELASAGVDVLIPLQRGPLSTEEMWGAICNELGADHYRPSIPSNAAPLPTAELVRFLKTCRPEKLHLLGMGQHNPKFAHRATMIRHLLPDIDLSCDSNRLRAWLGAIMDAERCQVVHEELVATRNQRQGVTSFEWDDTEIWEGVTLEEMPINVRVLLFGLLPGIELTDDNLGEYLLGLPPTATWLIERELMAGLLESHVSESNEGGLLRSETIRRLSVKDNKSRFRP